MENFDHVKDVMRCIYTDQYFWFTCLYEDRLDQGFYYSTRTKTSCDTSKIAVHNVLRALFGSIQSSKLWLENII